MASDSKHVLLVEDDPKFRPLLGEALRGVGHHVDDFDTAEKALAHFRTGARIDVVVTDLQLLGGIDGATMASNLIKEGFEGPILCISANPEMPASPDKSGHMRFLYKPFKQAEFLKVFNFLFQ